MSTAKLLTHVVDDSINGCDSDIIREALSGSLSRNEALDKSCHYSSASLRCTLEKGRYE